MEEIRNSNQYVTPETREKAKNYRYVLVRGFLNELICKYMEENKQALIEFGVPESQIHYISPPSRESIGHNSHETLEELQALADLGTQPLVLIGHSKGASNIVAFALQQKEFIEQKVKAILPIQGVFGGSGIADTLYFWSTKKSTNSTLGFPLRLS